MLLLTKVCALFRFSLFLLHAFFFLFQDLTQDTTWHLVVMSP